MRTLYDRLRWTPTLVATWGLALAMLTSVALAQPPAPSETFDIRLSAQPLAVSLTALSRQTGLQILAAGDLVAGKTAPAVAGRMTARMALERLLAGSGLQAAPSGQGFVVQRATRATGSEPPRPEPVPPAKAADERTPVVELPGIQVQGQTEETATGPLKGFVATRSASGTKTDTPLIETPQSISVVTKDQMIAQGAESVPQAFRYTSGIVAEQRGVNMQALEYLFARGFRVDEYLDGLQLPPTSLRFAVPSIDTYALERIELLKGPASVLYGQGFPSGIVNLVSKRPTAEPIRELELQTGNFGRFQAAFDFGGPIDREGHFLYRVVGLGRATDTQVDFDHQERIFIAPALTWRPTRDTTLTLLGNYRTDPQAGFYNGLPAAAVIKNPVGTLEPNFNPGDPSFDRHDQTSYSLGYLFEHRFDDTWTVRQSTRYTQAYDFIRALFGDSLNGDGRTLNRFQAFQDEVVKIFNIDTRVQAKFRTGPVTHTAIAGVDYQRIAYRDKGAFDFSGTAPTIDIFNPVYNQFAPVPKPTIRETFLSEQVGLYAQDQLKLGGFNLVGGVRNDWAWSTDVFNDEESKQSDRAVTGRVGIVYVFDVGLAPYASFATSFQPEPGTDFDGKPFQPTTGRQYEVGVKFQPRGVRAFVTVALFDLRQNNVTVPDPAHAFFSIQTGQVRSRGLEFEAHASPVTNLNLVAAYTYLDQNVTKSTGLDLGKRVPGMPSHSASMWADYTLPTGILRGLGFGASVRHVGRTAGDATNTFEVPASTLVDVGASYDFGAAHPSLKGGRLAVNVSNLLDHHYVASCINGFCTFGQERQVLGTLTYRW